MRTFILFVLVLHFNFFLLYGQTNSRYTTYTNNRFGYSFSYPSALLTQQPESENGDGAIFNNKQNKERIRCWGRLDLDTEGNKLSLKQRGKLDEANFKEVKAKLSYIRYTTTFCVLSGKYKNGINFYQKLIALPETDVFAYVLITYPDKEKKLWEPQIAKIAGSLQ